MIRGTLSDVCSAVVDCKNRTAPEDAEGSHFAVGTPAMRGNVINLSKARRINHATFAEWTARLKPEPGDLLFAREAPVGPVVEIPEGVSIAAGQRTMLLRANPEKANNRFLRYYLISPATQARIQALAQGSTVPHLRLPDVRNFRVELPELAEQNAIAEVLGALDDKIDANTKLAAVSDDLALSLLSACPATVPVSEIVSYKKGSINVSTLKSSTVAHFSLPAFDTGKLPVLCDPDEIKSNKAYVQAPSVLISKLNPRFPRVWDLLELPSEPAVASTEFLVLEPRFSSTSVLWTILSQEEFGRELETKVAGTSGSHQRIKPADLLATKAIDPRTINVETQQLITSLGQISFHCRRENWHLEATRDALLPPLMSGKLRVKDAEKVVEDAI